MKVRIKRNFKYMDGTKEKVLKPGIYDLDERMAGLALRWGKAELMVEKKPKVEKKAPENKVGEVPEDKAEVEEQPVRRGRPRTKPDE